MASGNNVLLNPKKTKMFWGYWILAVVFIVLGIFLMPVWGNTDVFWKNWWVPGVYLFIALLLGLYLFGYLIRKIKSGSNGTVKVLTIIEFILLGLIALACIFIAIPQIRASVPAVTTEACRIIGVALYLRGVVEIFRAYYNHDKSHYPVWWLCIVILFVTLGVWMFLQPFFRNVQIAWGLSILVLILGVIFLIDGFLAKPASRK